MIGKLVVIISMAVLAMVVSSHGPSTDSDGKALFARVEQQTLVVTLENKSDNDIVFWELGGMWGDGSFYLVLRNRETKKILIVQYGRAMYGRPVGQQVIKKGDKAEFRIDLNCHRWGDGREALNDTSNEIETVFLSPPIAEVSIRSGVFMDRLRYDFP